MYGGMRYTSIPTVQVSLRSAQDFVRNITSIYPKKKKEWTPPPKVAQKVEKISQGFYVLRVTQRELYEYDIERFYLTNNFLV